MADLCAWFVGGTEALEVERGGGGGRDTWGVGRQGQWRVGEGGDGDNSCIGMAEDSAGG